MSHVTVGTDAKKNPDCLMAISAEHRSKFADLHLQWSRLQTRTKISSGMNNSKPSNKHKLKMFMLQCQGLLHLYSFFLMQCQAFVYELLGYFVWNHCLHHVSPPYKMTQLIFVWNIFYFLRWLKFRFWFLCLFW